MPAIDLTETTQSIENQLNAVKGYLDNSKAKSDILTKAGNSFAKANSDISQQLNKITELQKKFQRNVPTSMDGLLNFLGMTSTANKSETYKYLRRKILETAVKVEPQIQEIITKNVFKALGCSEAQNFEAVSIQDLDLTPLPLRNVEDGLYIPIQSIDFTGALKKNPQSLYGKFYYERESPKPSEFPRYKSYGGQLNFPMNKQLYELIGGNNSTLSFWEVSQKYYQGKSVQPLFDIQYANFNGIDSGDFLRVILLQKTDGNGLPKNTVKDFVADYFKTIKLIDPVVILAQVINTVVGGATISKSFGPLKEQSAMGVIIQRILGLCFDSRSEIDVSGVSKIAELDGVDESFFELTEVDLRNIDVRISNIQNGVVEFVDCDNIKLPFDENLINDELSKFRDELSGLTENQIVNNMERIFDNITQNPEWQAAIDSGLDVEVSFNKNLIKSIPLAIASGILTPKVLLPIFIMLAAVQKKFNEEYNKLITDINSTISGVTSTVNPIIQSANTFANQAIDNANTAQNLVTSGVDFLKKFRKFSIETISQINAIFLKELFELLKKDIINLLRAVVKDIKRKSSNATIQKIILIIQLAAIAYQVVVTINNARKCKNLFDDIKKLISLILLQAGTVRVPQPLQFLSDLLPGYSPDRAEINCIEFMQAYGLPTGPLPDGTPNQVLLMMSSMLQGNAQEMQNMRVDATVISPTDGPLKVFGFPT